MALYVKRHLQKNGIRVITGVKAEEILGNDQVTGVRTSTGIPSLLPSGVLLPESDQIQDSLQIQALKCLKARFL